MMQGFYLLAVQRAQRRTYFAVLACLAAAAALCLAWHSHAPAPAVPADAVSCYTVRSEDGRLVVRQSDGTVLHTAIDTRALPSADREALQNGISLNSAEELARLLENYSS